MKPLTAFASRHRYSILLIAIVMLGAVLRFYHLGFQSLWYDEIHSAAESDPAYRDHSLWYFLMHVDQQPPLFFLIERVFIFFFGNNEIGVRLFPALAGTACIWAVFRLGKTLADRQTGSYAALFLAVNAYGIKYSMEARPYSLALFFSILSWTAMLQLLRDLSLRRTLVYVLWTVLMLYSNYFSVFVVMAQALAGALLIIEEQKRQLYIRRFLTAGIITGVCFLPLLIFLQHVVAIDAFWTGVPDEDFGIRFFYEYFGHSDLLKPFLLLLLICFFIRLILEQPDSGTAPGIKGRPMALLAFISILWIAICFMIPFVRSYLVVPMLVSRYTIMVLPAFIVVIAAGLGALPARMLRNTVAVLFCLLSLTHLILVTNYYDTVSKSQFRELAKFMAAPGAPQVPVIAYNTFWQQRYYLKRFGYHGVVQEDQPLPAIEAKLQQPAREAFWLTAAHGGISPDTALTSRLIDSGYIVARDIRLYDAWGQLFVPKNFFGDSVLTLSPVPDPSVGKTKGTDNMDYLALWLNRSLAYEPVRLERGLYTCIIQGNSTLVAGIGGHLICKVNGTPVGHYFLNAGLDIRTFRFSLAAPSAARVELEFDNDAGSKRPAEDRNAFIHRVMIRREKQTPVSAK
jgi:uncharacterized membrane protein